MTRRSNGKTFLTDFRSISLGNDVWLGAPVDSIDEVSIRTISGFYIVQQRLYFNFYIIGTVGYPTNGDQTKSSSELGLNELMRISDRDILHHWSSGCLKVFNIDVRFFIGVAVEKLQGFSRGGVSLEISYVCHGYYLVNLRNLISEISGHVPRF